MTDKINNNNKNIELNADNQLKISEALSIWKN